MLLKFNDKWFKEQGTVTINWKGLKLFKVFSAFYNNDKGWINMKNLHKVYPNCKEIKILNIDTDDILFEQVLIFLNNEDHVKIRRFQFD